MKTSTPGSRYPEVIYHYCRPDGCVKILESRAVWLSNRRLLNDTSDSSHFRELVGKEVKKLGRKADHETRKRIRTFKQELDYFHRHEVYVTSFSAVGDMLSQWRAYGDDGEGFAIGFATSELGADVDMFPAPGGTATLFRVTYDHQSSESKLLAEALQRGVSISKWSVAVLCDAANLSSKNPAFSEEKEYRLGYRPITSVPAATARLNAELKVDGALKTINFRNTKHGLCPYFAYEFPLPCVRELVLGPKNRSEIPHVEMLLAKLGYSNVQIKRSAASYR